MTPFRMPSLGADMEAGTLVEWLKKPGDPVRRGDIIAVVETQKGAIEIEIFEAGVLDAVLVQPGQKVPVGTVLAAIRGADEPAGAALPATVPPPPVTPIQPATPAPPPAVAPAPSVSGARLRISPAAAARAAALGIDPRGLAGSGPGGAIGLADVEAAARPAAAAPPPTAATPAEAMRKAIAVAMSRSKREIPHYYLTTTIDMEPALTWMEMTNAERPVTARLLYGALLLKAAARALREVPELNGFWRDGRPMQAERVNVGWAVAMRGGGLIAPAIRDADARPLDDLMAALRDLVKRVRGGGLRSSELGEATVTASSLGDQGVEAILGVIYPPQVALIGFGRIVERPWAVGGDIKARRVMTASLSADHRASDGHRGALFLLALDRLLQKPEAL
ncbi:MAG: dihydrolipoamide acetyltransferase family protein [Rhodospirillales bacterium]